MGPGCGGRLPLNKRPAYVFSVNPGRSGSEYLSTLFASVEGTLAFHEAKPTMSGPVLEAAMRHGLDRTRRDRLVKVAEIRRLLEASGASTYVETNHMFAKTFFDVALEELPPAAVAIVILRRPWAKVMRSFLSLGYFTHRRPVWIDWMRVPRRKGPAEDSVHHGNPMEAAAEYLLKLEQRSHEIQDWYPEVTYVDSSLETLQSFEGVKALFDRLGLGGEGYGDLESRIGTRINERLTKKQRLQIPAPSEQQCRAFLEDFLHARAATTALDKVVL